MELTFKNKKTKTIEIYTKAKSLIHDTKDKLWTVRTSDVNTSDYSWKEYKLLKIVFK